MPAAVESGPQTCPPIFVEEYADLISTLATDTHGPTLTYFSVDHAREKDMSVCVCVGLWLILHLLLDFEDSTDGVRTQINTDRHR